MNLAVDGGKLLYALGVAFALGALVYFTRDVVFGLSVTVTALLLFVGFLAAFVAGLALDHDVLDVVAYALSGLSYLVGVGYVLTRYTVGETGTFLLLGVSAALFLGLGYAVREHDLAVDGRTAQFVLVGTLAVSGVFVGADAATGGVTYTTELDDETTARLTPAEAAEPRSAVEVSVGTVVARNDSPFTRPIDLPSGRACVVGVDTQRVTDRLGLRYDPRPDGTPLAGGGERSYELQVIVPTPAGNETSVTYGIERGESCDVRRETPTILLVDDESAAD